MIAREMFDKIKQARAVQAAAALASFLGGGGVTVDAAVYDARYGTCKGCEHFRPGDYPKCNECGCLLKIKCRFPAEKCPLPTPKWGVERAAEPPKQCGGCP